MADQTIQTGLSENAASGIAYITFIPAIIFLATAPYNQSTKIRFHSWQSIFLAVAWVAVSIVLRIFLGVMPFMFSLGLMLWPLLELAFFIVWILCLIKALNGQMFKLPVIGDLAEKQAGGAGI